MKSIDNVYLTACDIKLTLQFEDSSFDASTSSELLGIAVHGGTEVLHVDFLPRILKSTSQRLHSLA